ncbi:aldehyde:ferredoxin oxidoreductase [Candidatus Methanoperedens nitroreducens]|uniref:Aldehyde:ferredoxin oxidoreductase n=1 Tax=Candidatus Methanoperedens nitratireducens TaxID=1392998 RepID=A0A062V1F2_9EURY|nr:aldehyde ferredoxin oxidoreductase family protein [Candidatus Methanoperedens nitroreducens]KCZ70428.1 aldehyde:ferredoxin oxidoreductase [Candidatus Methanoperedens nitroreducens]MDJ1420867.1 aldehyde ferredoxin oxidoreductase family protein [Candidatus Methanoperedens sp.]
MHGWTGRIVIIDLTDSRITQTKSDTAILHSFIGGRGLGVKLYCDAIHPGIYPLAPENILIFATGPLTGTASPMSGRHVMVSKSPLTGTIFDSSSGGFFGKELKFAGIDALIIKGKAKQPVYISIINDDIDILPAGKLWGENVRSCTHKLSPQGHVACIGRAGERLVTIANVMNDYFHACGRGGLGAVMGSKNLKAVVVKGDQRPAIADEEGFEKARQDALRLIKAGPVASKGLSTYGTSALVNLMNYMKILPTRNFQNSEFGGADRVSGEFIKEHYDIKGHACYNCIIACKHIIKSGALEGHEIPEYETLWAYGPDSNNADMDDIIRANRLCNDYGIDTISSGSTIAAYAEIMNEDITELSELVKKIGENEGLGKELGKGSKALSGSYGKDVAMHAKGLELPGYDPRGVLGMALAYATSNRGGCHLRAYMVAPEILGKPKKIDRLTFSGKAGLVQIFQNEMASLDSLVLCKFASFAVSEEEFANLLSSATGIDYSTEEFLRCGERIWNLERLFNIRAGFTRKDDTLPERFFGSGGINRVEFERTLDEYYHFRGWDENGIPTEEKLRELNL